MDIDGDVQWIGHWKVTSVGDVDAGLRILAVPDVCCSAWDQFRGFWGYCLATDSLPQLQRARVHYIDPPGQSVGGPALDASYWPGWDEYVSGLRAVVDKVGDGPMVGFGVGAGADLLIRLCVDKMTRIRGLVLFAPLVTDPNYVSWIPYAIAASFMNQLGWNEHVIGYGLRPN